MQLLTKRARRRVGSLVDELLSILLVREGWFFDSAEGSQSRYGYSDNKATAEALANRVKSVQQDHKRPCHGDGNVAARLYDYLELSLLRSRHPYMLPRLSVSVNCMGLITCVSDLGASRAGSRLTRAASQLTLPTHFLQILLAVEDKRYLQHPGIDLLAVVRAAFADLRAAAWVQGASTITQQVVRLQKPEPGWPSKRSLRVKVRQAWQAVRYERMASKVEILDRYLKGAYFGRGYYGLQAASYGYFRVAPQDLTAAQSLFMADRLALPSTVRVSRLCELLARRPIARVLGHEGMNEVVAIYEERFYCGDEIWRALVKSPKKSAAPTLSY